MRLPERKYSTLSFFLKFRDRARFGHDGDVERVRLERVRAQLLIAHVCQQLNVLFVLRRLRARLTALDELLHVLDRVAPVVVDHPIQQPVLHLVVHAGDLERGGLGQLAGLPSGEDARHLEAFFNDLQVADLRRVDLHLLGDPLAQPDRKLLSGLLAAGCRFP